MQAPQKDISLALFDAGVNAFNSRKYEEAQRSFSDFLKNYKDHSQAPEAQYYLAECYFQRNQFADAALAYDTVIKKYPKSSSAPGAYLKQGISFSKLNQGAAAKARMQELIKKYPSSPEAARAKTFLKTNKRGLAALGVTSARGRRQVLPQPRHAQRAGYEQKG